MNEPTQCNRNFYKYIITFCNVCTYIHFLQICTKCGSQWLGCWICNHYRSWIRIWATTLPGSSPRKTAHTHVPIDASNVTIVWCYRIPINLIYIFNIPATFSIWDGGVTDSLKTRSSPRGSMPNLVVLGQMVPA